MGHAMAETPAEAARVHLYIHSRDLSHLLSQSINQPFLSYLSSGYEPGSQGIFIDEAFSLYCIFVFVDLTCHLQVCRPSPAEQQNATWPCYEYQRSINQQPNTTWYHSVADCYFGLATGLFSWPCYRPFLLHGPCYRFFLLPGPTPLFLSTGYLFQRCGYCQKERYFLQPKWILGRLSYLQLVQDPRFTMVT